MPAFFFVVNGVGFVVNGAFVILFSEYQYFSVTHITLQKCWWETSEHC